MINKKSTYLILFFKCSLVFSQSPCNINNITAGNTSIYPGNSTSISLSIPIGTVQWQQSNDGINWTDVTSGNSSSSTSSASSATISFSYTGASQTFTIPSGVTTIRAEGIGAAGGRGRSTVIAAGGLGGRLISDLTVTPGEKISVFVGGKGGNAKSTLGGASGTSLGGFNGGGWGRDDGGGGGGGTDIRRGGIALNDRIFVVGGGGGGGEQEGSNSAEKGGNGGNGGGGTAGNGIPGAGSSSSSGGKGGTQSAGGFGGLAGSNGDLGVGGNSTNTIRRGGGGGGGYYGGGSGGNNGSGQRRAGGGGGGGSSFSSGPITTNELGYTSATGDGSLTISYTIPAQTTSTYTTPNLVSNTYYRAEVSDNSCTTTYSSAVYISLIDAPFLTSSVGTDLQTVIINAPISNITYSASNAINSSSNGVAGANGLPPGVSATVISNTLTISGAPSSSGVYNYAIPLTTDCGTTNVSGTITVDPIIITGPNSATGSTSSLSINENTLAIHTFSSNSMVSWSLGNANDEALLSIDSNGNLVFKNAPDYENPLSTSSSNTYTVKIVATNAANNSTNQTLTITILDIANSPFGTFTAITKQYFKGSHTIVPPTTNNTSPITYTSDNSAVATVNGSVITFTGVGTTNITATQAADANFEGNIISTVLTVIGKNLASRYGGVPSTAGDYISATGEVGGDFWIDKYGKQGNVSDAIYTIPFGNYFDFETGTMCTDCNGPSEDYDLIFEAGSSDVRARMWWNQQYADMALVYDKSFDNLTSADIANYYYCDYVGDTNSACINVDTPPTNFVGIYHTNSGNYYAVQYLSEDATGVTFNYKRLR
jgi:hypothetical protein